MTTCTGNLADVHEFPLSAVVGQLVRIVGHPVAHLREPATLEHGEWNSTATHVWTGEAWLPLR